MTNHQLRAQLKASENVAKTQHASTSLQQISEVGTGQAPAGLSGGKTHRLPQENMEIMWIVYVLYMYIIQILMQIQM